MLLRSDKQALDLSQEKVISQDWPFNDVVKMTLRKLEYPHRKFVFLEPIDSGDAKMDLNYIWLARKLSFPVSPIIELKVNSWTTNNPIT